MRTAVLALSLIILLTFSFVISPVRAPGQAPEIPLEGDVTFKVYPGGEFSMVASVGLEQDFDPPGVGSPIRGVSFAFDIEVMEDDLYGQTGSLVFEMGSMYAIFLSNLDLDVEIHGERLSSEATFRVTLPGMVAAEGRMETAVDEGTLEGVMDLEANATVWFSLLPEQAIQGFMDELPELKAELETLIYENSEHSLVLEVFTVDEVERGELSATFALEARIAGDFSSLVGLFENAIPSYLDDDVKTSVIPENWEIPTMRSGDLHIYFDGEDLAFNVDFEALMEGDPDATVNDAKDLFFEKLLEEYSPDPDAARLIDELLLPTELGVSDLHAELDVSIGSDSVAMGFEMDGLILRPPTPVVLLEYLEEASNKAPMEDVTLTFEGMSHGGEYVEIEVPELTTEPLSEEPTRVVWAFADLENLDQVSFSTMESEEEEDGGASPIGTQTILLVGGGAVVLAAAAWMLTRRQ